MAPKRKLKAEELFQKEVVIMLHNYGPLHKVVPPLRTVRLIVVEGFVCLGDPRSYAGGSLTPGRSNQAGQVRVGERPD